MIRHVLHFTYRAARRIVVSVVGVTVVLIGLILIFTPGPALVVIPAGLAILSIEFAWARRWLRTMKEKSKAAVNHVRNNRAAPDPPGDQGSDGGRGGGGV